MCILSALLLTICQPNPCEFKYQGLQVNILNFNNAAKQIKYFFLVFLVIVLFLLVLFKIIYFNLIKCIFMIYFK